ncbi:hypothetical protein BC835DRAFT_1419578 [Cytidiella melzeri]|nr:hypothetical protein BC835DRAFT_1419578 [Cytidiella melzeri]
MDTSTEYASTSIHPLEHAVRITYDVSAVKTSSPSVKTVQAHATFKRAILVPDDDDDAEIPDELFQPQFWFVKLVVPKGLPLYRGIIVDRVKLKPGGRQFGSDGCKSALKEISSSSLDSCHYAWVEDPHVVISHRWSAVRYAPWVTAAQLLRRISVNFMSRFVHHTSYLYDDENSWSWSGEPEVLLTDTAKIVQVYISYTFRCVMVLLASHPAHMIRDLGEDNTNAVLEQRMKDLRGWIYDQRVA